MQTRKQVLSRHFVATGCATRTSGDGAGTQQTATGAVLHVYERDGNLKYGEMEVGEETVIFDADSARR